MRIHFDSAGSELATEGAKARKPKETLREPIFCWLFVSRQQGYAKKGAKREKDVLCLPRKRKGNARAAVSRALGAFWDPRLGCADASDDWRLES
jgi:hypothetical protein